MTKKKLALILLLLGIGCLIGYILLLFYTEASALIVTALVLSIACNAAAVNLYLSAREKRRERDDV
ncbi:MAG: hypothetical protein HFG26_08140 [Provencibacterium sp.]|jgi:multisubunit Na+/H+ antiporter MnhC subunit|nr:hypothetical protein [Provencibacterium sp.]